MIALNPENEDAESPENNGLLRDVFSESLGRFVPSIFKLTIQICRRPFRFAENIDDSSATLRQAVGYYFESIGLAAFDFLGHLQFREPGR